MRRLREMKIVEFKDLIGKTFTHIKGDQKDEIVTFISSDGYRYHMAHEQDCCESVYLDDIAGDIGDLLNTPILQAEEVISCNEEIEGVGPAYAESFTWTFYKLATAKGWVTFRWFGESNGYYSESVDVYEERLVI